MQYFSKGLLYTANNIDLDKTAQNVASHLGPYYL